LNNNVIRRIIELLSEKRSLSRQDLAVLTEKSYPTITKYTDYLTETGVLRASYSNAKKGDTKSTRFNLNNAKYFAIFDLGDNDYRIHICALTGKIKNTVHFIPSPKSDFEENKYYFIKNINYQLSKYGKSKYCGAAIIVPENYDDNLIYKARINFLIKSIHLTKPSLIKRPLNTEIQIIQAKLSSSDFALCLFLNKNRFTSCYLNKSSDIDNLSLGEIGTSYKINDIPLKDYIDYMEDPIDVVNAMHKLIESIKNTVPINQVYISGNLYRNMEALTELISERFESNELKFSYVDKTEYIPFVVKELRCAMTNDIICNYLSK